MTNMLVYPETAPEKLGFQLVLETVASHLVSEAGRAALDEEPAASTREEAELKLAWTFEVQRALQFDDALPWSELPDIRSLKKQLRPAGSFADGEQLLDLAAVLAASRRIGSYFASRRDAYPEVTEEISAIDDFGEVEESISRSIGRDGSVQDTASAELQRLRRALSTRERDLRRSLNEELRQAVASGFATEEQPTIRNGRMVIPVRAEAKRKVRGFVQDASSTGQTVYIEPESCLELNNELRELQADEAREVRRILVSVADVIRDRLHSIAATEEVMARFDVIQAKARTAILLEGVVPQLNDGERLRIVDGRNPALLLRFRQQKGDAGPRDVVPLSLELTDGSRTVLITGPNAGGKTVALATVGLFALLVGYGIPIPADDATELPFFEKVLVDIGDEQSIEHDLSTFSSHLRNLTRMIEEADRKALVLIDEAGTGTDPEEGSALAQAALENLTASHAWTIATTHHGRLKAFAHGHAGVRNGAMEFDRESLAPTYRFKIDVPGSSYAFDIGRRMGFPGELLSRARELVGESKATLEDLIADYEEKVGELTALKESLERERTNMQRAREEYESSLGKLRSDRSRAREEALRSADRLLRNANAEIERTIREIRESQAERKATRAARKGLEAFRSKVESQIEDIETIAEAAAPSDAGGDIAVGDQVVLDDGAVKAEVAELDGTHAVIVNKTARLRVKRDRLRRVGGKAPQKVEVRQTTTGSGGAGLPAESVQQRIDLRGARVDDGLARVRQFIDAALPSGLTRLEILHGKGTGALRSAVWEYLESRPEVARFEEAAVEQGGAGVTVVHLQ